MMASSGASEGDPSLRYFIATKNLPQPTPWTVLALYGTDPSNSNTGNGAPGYNIQPDAFGEDIDIFTTGNQSTPLRGSVLSTNAALHPVLIDPFLDESTIALGSEINQALTTIVDTDDLYMNATTGILSGAYLGPGDDTLIGSGFIETLVGGDGDDSLMGFEDNDVIYGDWSNVPIYKYVADSSTNSTPPLGQPTDPNRNPAVVIPIVKADLGPSKPIYEVILPGLNDAARAGVNGGEPTGSDYIDGGAGSDELYGGPGIDTLSFASSSGGANADLKNATVQDGTGGVDTISGFENLIGGSSNDTLVGDANPNTIDGGGGSDNLDGDGGVDTLAFASATGGVLVDLNAGTAQDGTGGTDTVSNFEVVIGTTFNDSLTGDTNANTLVGGNGDDFISGVDGNNTLSGGDGNDTLYAGVGAGGPFTNQTTGGAGRDTFVLDYTYSGNQFAAYGWATVMDFDLTEDFIGLTNGLTYDDLIFLQDFPSQGGWKIMVFQPDGLSQTVLASFGDVNIANLPQDRFISLPTTGPIEEVLAGTEDDNELSGSSRNERLVGREGNDELSSDEGDDLLEGGDGDDRLDAGPGNDTLFGQEGADTLLGSDGDDDLFGGGDADVLVGGLGDDTLNGGRGRDELWGDQGQETFTGTARDMFGDTIRQFELGDEIRIVGLDNSPQITARTPSETVISFDTDGDGRPDGALTVFLAGPETTDGLQILSNDGDIVIGLHPDMPPTLPFDLNLSGLQDKQEQAFANGIIDQSFLDGDGSRDFEVTLVSNDNFFASRSNSLGVYEIDGSGNILNTQILFGNAKTDTGTRQIDDVEDGHTLGFFLVQDGAKSLDDLSDTVFDVVNEIEGPVSIAEAPALKLSRNGEILTEILFHTFDAGLNRDGVTHAMSGIEGNIMTIAMEDIFNGGDRDFEDVVFTVEILQ